MRKKEELIDNLNSLIGLLITLRTVETSPLSTNHWVNSYIDSMSNFRNFIEDGLRDCEDCLNGCISCHDIGINKQTISELQEELTSLKNQAASCHSTSIYNKVSDIEFVIS